MWHKFKWWDEVQVLHIDNSQVVWCNTVTLNAKLPTDHTSLVSPSWMGSSGDTCTKFRL